jgi:hypothetical protein
MLFDRHCMCVDPEREFGVAVAELLRNPTNRTPSGQRQRCEGVACVVESKRADAVLLRVVAGDPRIE